MSGQPFPYHLGPPKVALERNNCVSYFPLGRPNFRVGMRRRSDAEAVPRADVSRDDAPRKDGAGHSRYVPKWIHPYGAHPPSLLPYGHGPPNLILPIFAF
jgi:hypothetical protein